MRKGATSRGDPISKARADLIREIQQEAVKLEVSGQALPTESFKVGGKDRTRHFAGWYFTRNDAVFTQARYDQCSLFKQPDDTPMAMQARKELKDLLVFYNGLIAAAEKGELDALLKPFSARKKP